MNNQVFRMLFSKERPIFLYLVVILLPVAITFALIHFCFHTNLMTFHAGWSDEVFYRQEVLTFAEAGFDGGFFSTDEVIANSEFSRFGTHGPVYALTHGWIARIIGFREYAGPVINLFAITFALFYFFITTRPNLIQSIFLALVIGLFFPLSLYLPSLMQESIHQSIGVVFAAFLVRSKNGSRPPLIMSIFTILAIIYGSLLRVTWGLAAFPVAYILLNGGFRKKILPTILIGLSFSFSMFWLYSSWTSTYSDGFLFKLLQQVDFSSAIRLLVNNVSQNVRSFLWMDTGNGELATLFHYQIVLIMVGWGFLWKKEPTLTYCNLFLLLANLLLNLLFYRIGYYCDYRVLAPFVLISMVTMVFMIPSKKSSLLILLLIILSNVGFLLKFVQTYEGFHIDHFGTNQNPVADTFRDTLGGLIYQQDAPPWCNSLLTNHASYDELRLLPPGIGINTLINEALYDHGVKSRYLFVPQTFIEKVDISTTCQTIITLEGNTICVQHLKECDG